MLLKRSICSLGGATEAFLLLPISFGRYESALVVLFILCSGRTRPSILAEAAELEKLRCDDWELLVLVVEDPADVLVLPMLEIG